MPRSSSRAAIGSRPRRRPFVYGSRRRTAIRNILAVLAQTVDDGRDGPSRHAESGCDLAASSAFAPEALDPGVEAVRLVTLRAAAPGRSARRQGRLPRDAAEQD